MFTLTIVKGANTLHTSQHKSPALALAELMAWAPEINPCDWLYELARHGHIADVLCGAYVTITRGVN